MKRNLMVAGLVGLMVISGSTGVFADTSKKEVKAYELVPASIEALHIGESQKLLVETDFVEVSEAELKELIKSIDISKGHKIMSEQIKLDEAKLIKSGFISEAELMKLLKNSKFEKGDKGGVVVIDGEMPDGFTELIEVDDMDTVKAEMIKATEIIKINE